MDRRLKDSPFGREGDALVAWNERSFQNLSFSWLNRDNTLNICLDTLPRTSKSTLFA